MSWMLKHLTQPARIPRKARRGFSLFEAVLVMLLFIPAVSLASRIASDYALEAAGVQEARLLTRVVDAGATLALRDLEDQIAHQTGIGKTRVLSLDDLAREDVWPDGGDRLTSLGREISVIFYAQSSDALVILARASTLPGETTPGYVPRGGEGVGLVGYVPPTSLDRLRGPGLDYDLSRLRAGGVAFEGRDVAAFRILRMDRHVLPFLHRVSKPGRPELNRMETDLDLGGNDLTGIDTLEAENVTVADAFDITTLTGDLSVTGNVETSGTLRVTGEITTANLTATGIAQARQLEVRGSATIDTLTTTSLTNRGALSARDLVVEGQARINRLATARMTATTITASNILTRILGVTELASANATFNRAIIRSLTTGRCTGC
ncbi:hypothetical protein [Ruegeria atlantica]|uniref:hypothetical protein n=1 Tax=Ruegeria atlantica TaxID=81569 RepID=UPI0014817D6A|nr:hypothetical protein [Ruegeria atlantica]